LGGAWSIEANTGGDAADLVIEGAPGGWQRSDPRRRSKHTMNEEDREEERRWTAEIVSVAAYSSVIVVLLFLYVRYF
jgi:hypothetical protein